MTWKVPSPEKCIVDDTVRTLLTYHPLLLLASSVPCTWHFVHLKKRGRTHLVITFWHIINKYAQYKIMEREKNITRSRHHLGYSLHKPGSLSLAVGVVRICMCKHHVVIHCFKQKKKPSFLPWCSSRSMSSCWISPLTVSIFSRSSAVLQKEIIKYYWTCDKKTQSLFSFRFDSQTVRLYIWGQRCSEGLLAPPLSDQPFS